MAGFDPLRQPLEVKRRVGYMPDQVGFYDNLSGIVNLRYTAHLAGIAARDIDGRIEQALQRVGLDLRGWQGRARPIRAACGSASRSPKS